MDNYLILCCCRPLDKRRDRCSRYGSVAPFPSRKVNRQVPIRQLCRGLTEIRLQLAQHAVYNEPKSCHLTRWNSQVLLRTPEKAPGYRLQTVNSSRWALAPSKWACQEQHPNLHLHAPAISTNPSCKVALAPQSTSGRAYPDWDALWSLLQLHTSQPQAVFQRQNHSTSAITAYSLYNRPLACVPASL